MPSNDNFRTCICKHITPIDTCWPILRYFETFWDILKKLEQFSATLSNLEQFLSDQCGSLQFWAVLSSFFGPAWVISSNFEHFCRASLGHAAQFWTVFGNTIWHCRPWTVFKMSQLRLLWDILLWLKKVADVNPTDLDPKTRSVSTYIYNNNYYYIYIIMCVYIYIYIYQENAHYISMFKN